MRKYFYFIENDNGEWYFIDKRKKPQETFVIDDNIYHYDEWTINPLKAYRFESIEQAENYITALSKKEKLQPYTITEHEFVINKV